MILDITKFKQLEEYTLINQYLYGSRVYGTYNENSDYDYIIITNQKEPKIQIEEEELSITSYNIDEFLKQLKEHEISVLECIFLEDKFKIINTIEFRGFFELNLPKLRHVISSKSSNSWVKCKKKLIIKEDYNPLIAKKSLFHSLRIIDFGIQIAQYEQIQLYDSLPLLFDEIMSQDNNWKLLDDKYRDMKKDLLTNFRKLAPKK